MGDWRPVTERGKLIMRKAFEEKGVLRDQPLYLRQLPANELVLKDGQAEYQVIDGNHRLTVIRQLGNLDLLWKCNIAKVMSCSLF